MEQNIKRKITEQIVKQNHSIRLRLEREESERKKVIGRDRLKDIGGGENHNSVKLDLIKF